MLEHVSARAGGLERRYANTGKPTRDEKQTPHRTDLIAERQNLALL